MPFPVLVSCRQQTIYTLIRVYRGGSRKGLLRHAFQLIDGLVRGLQVGPGRSLHHAMTGPPAGELALFEASPDCNFGHTVGARSHRVHREVHNPPRRAGDAVDGPKGSVTRAIVGGGVME